MRLILLFVSLLAINDLLSQQAIIQVSSGINGTTTNTCNGFIIDSGGQGGSGYSNSENVTYTICPDVPGDIISVIFNLFALDQTNTGTSQNPILDQMEVFDGTSTAATYLGSYTGTQLQAVLIQCTPQNLTGCLTFRFKSNGVGTGFFAGSATCTTPCADPTAGAMVLNGISNDSIHVCIGEQVDFQDLGSFAQNGFSIASYNWDFMDGGTATGTSASHTFTDAGHYRVQLFVTDNNGCINNNLTDIDVLVATPPDFVDFQRDTSMCIGESLLVGADPILYENTWTGFSGLTEINDGCLLDTQLGVAQNIDIIQTGFSAGTTITSVNQILSLCVDMEHSYMGDLVISISCPNGQNVILHQQGGGGTQIGIPNQLDNVDCTDPTTMGTPFTYCFTPTATQTWVEWVNAQGGFGMTIPAGDYEPVQSLAGLVGCPTNGVWTMTVVDNWAADDGVVFSFGMTLDPALYPNLVQFTPEHGTDQDSSYWDPSGSFLSYMSSNADTMIITPTQTGTFTYNYTIVNSFGCTNDTSFQITVDPFVPPFAIDDTMVCAGNFIDMVDQSSDCQYTIHLNDSWGDGWNGNHLLVNNNGVNSSLTLNNGTDITFTVTVTHGQNFSFNFDGVGSFTSECSYEIIDSEGNVIFQDGGNFNPPVTGNNTVVVDCYMGYDFSWSPASLFNDPTLPNPNAFFPTSATVSMSVYPTGHPLCAIAQQMLVNIMPNSYVGMDSTVSICQTNVPVDLFPYLGPGANPNGTWADPNGNAVVMPLDPVTMGEGDYVYSVSANGCDGFATISINKFSPTINNITITDATCVNKNDGSAVVTGANFSSYSVNGGLQLPSQSPFTINSLAEGNYTLTVYGSPGCLLNQSFFVDDPDSLEITFITPLVTICEGDSAQLSVNATGGSSAYLYNWSSQGNFVSDFQTIDVLPAGAFTDYCVTLTEVCGSISVTQCTAVQFEQEIVPILVSPDPNVCVGEELTFNDLTFNQNVMSTFIAFGDGDSLNNAGLQTFNHTYDAIGTYSLSMQVISMNGCYYDNNFSNLVSVHQNPVAHFGINPESLTILSPTAKLINQSSLDALSFEWYMPGSVIDSAYTEDSEVNYPIGIEAQYPVTLTVTNFYGCVDSATRIIEVENIMTIYLPNSFTPNGDELNNVWKVYAFGIDISDFSLMLFDRWGELIFQTNDPEVGWDGTFNNTAVGTGIYQWRLKALNLLTNEPFEMTGFVNVFR